MTQNEFIEALKELKININDKQLDQLERYYELLTIWNNKINLTRIIEKEDVYLKHFYDSLTINKIIDLNSIDNMCDLGTGAGFPGLVIKILFPNIKMVLVDALNKRINFLNEVIKELKLDRIETVHMRIEDYGKVNREKFDLVVARAVAPLNVLVEYAGPIVKVNHYFLAMKSLIDEELENSLTALKILNLKIEKEVKFLLPNENSNRTLLLLKKFDVTNKKYPRNPREIKKKPL